MSYWATSIQQFICLPYQCQPGHTGCYQSWVRAQEIQLARPVLYPVMHLRAQIHYIKYLLASKKLSTCGFGCASAQLYWLYMSDGQKLDHTDLSWKETQKTVDRKNVLSSEKHSYVHGICVLWFLKAHFEAKITKLTCFQGKMTL